MIVADASWIIALRDPGDAHHDAAVRLNQAAGNEAILVHPVTLAECLVGPAQLGVAEEAARMAHAAFEIAEQDDNAPLRWAKLRAACALRLPDVIVLDTAIVHQASALLTFDERLASEATARSISAPSDG